MSGILTENTKHRIIVTINTLLNLVLDAVVTGAFYAISALMDWFIRFLGYHNDIISLLIYWMVQPIFFISLVTISLYHLWLGFFPPKQSDIGFEIIAKNIEDQSKNKAKPLQPVTEISYKNKANDGKRI